MRSQTLDTRSVTSASWLNMVERFFRGISTDRLERGVFRSDPELTAAIEGYIVSGVLKVT